MITLRRFTNRLNEACCRPLGLIAVLLTLSSFPLTAFSQLSVGNGTPSYSIPIAVPPGIAGVTPNIGLLYSASTVNGPVGLGWTIQGISMITRCPGSKRVDGYARRVDYTSNDKLCLDGQRLIQTSDTGTVVNASISNPGVANPFQQNDSLGGSGMVREYRTEKDMNARIRGYGSAGGNAANGPAYFKVWTKSGQMYEYGVNANATSNAAITASGSSVIAAWPVSRISDTVGNYIDFQYEQRDVAWGSGTAANTPTAGHEWNLTEIRYTGNGAQLPVNRVVFSYEDRPDTPNAAQDRAEAYHQGSKTVSIRRLAAVRTYVNWPADQSVKPASAVPVKMVKLTYDNGPVSQRSRLKQVTECSGADETKCLPPTVFNYFWGGGVQFTTNNNFKSGDLAALPLTGTKGEYGVLTGTFFGSGRTDILRWGNDASQNVLYRSAGDGVFVEEPSSSKGGLFNLVGQRLFSDDGCYTAVAADFNGDGLTDILRVMKAKTASGTSCGTVQNLLFKSNGDGSFSVIDLTGTGIDFTQQTSVQTVDTHCRKNVTCQYEEPIYARTDGKNYFLLDVNGDGLLDIVTTILPGFRGQMEVPTVDSLCASVACTKVFFGTTGGGFVQVATNLTNQSVYAAPLDDFKKNHGPVMPYVADINGDGLADLLVALGTWVSRGDGNFDNDAAAAKGVACKNAVDFNGDGRADCLTPGTTADYQRLSIADGTYSFKYATTTNLTTPGYELDDINTGKFGFALGDFDGDGRTDILRWKDDPTQNILLLSNGDSTFRTAPLFNVNTVNDQLQKSDGTATFITGDFTGNGTIEILRMLASPANGARNTLYVKYSPTPPDQLISVTSPTKLTTTVTWVSLPNTSGATFGRRYVDDRRTGNAASYPVTDLTIPMYVVATTRTDTTTGSTLATEYSYAGLKFAGDGRGWLGFREVRAQQVAPSGDYLTVLTRYLQVEPFIGMPATTETRLGALDTGGLLIRKTTNIYCDTTTAAGAETSATAVAPCASSSKLQRPYLYQSREEGWDLNGVALPVVTTTNTFDSIGDPTKIIVETVGTAVGGITQKFTKTTTNQYYADSTSGDTWILGRLSQATVQNVVPNSISSISTSAGSAPNAGAVNERNGPPPAPTLPPMNAADLIPIIMQILDDDA